MAKAGRDGDATPQAETAFRQLCHALSLSRTGKVQSAVDNLVLTILCIDPKVGRGGDPNEVATAVSTYFGVTLDIGDIRAAFETHLRAGRLQIDRTETPNWIVLSPAVRAEVTARIADSTNLEEQVKGEWLPMANAVAPGVDLDSLWSALQVYLGEVFSQHGAEAVQILDARAPMEGDKGNLTTLLNRAIDEAGLQSDRADVSDAIRTFFRNPSSNRLRYLSELLDGAFTFFALTVSDATADYLKGQIPSLRLFLDTNVVLGVLGMQDNPLQEACVELLDVIRSEAFPFKLYYHDRTFEEILDILEAARNSLRRRHFSSALSRAYLQYMAGRGGGFGLEAKFHSLNAEQEIDVEAFLARFNHVEELLKAQGVLRYRQSGADLNVETKGQYIAEFQHFLEVRARPGRPPRRYEAVDHDITVWLYLQRQRSRATNALRSGALLLSNDYSLHSFDRTWLMRQQSGLKVPTVVLPHHLLQVLRPLSRVTPKFDQRFMEVFAAPEFRTTQTDYGETASKVLSYLASFDGVPTETAVHILNDDLLMGRLRDAEITDPEFGELIESAVIDKNNALVDQLREAARELEVSRQSVEEARREAEAERTAREQTELMARESEAAAEGAARRVVAELEEARLREAAEADARQAAHAKALEEEASRRKLEEDLADERRLRQAAEASATSNARRMTFVRSAVASVFGVAAVVAITWGPGWISWHGFLRNERHHSFQALGDVAFLGLAYVAAGWRYKGTVAVGVVVAAVIAALTLL